MTPQPAIGVLLHALGGFAAGSFYSPLKLISGWAWESLWLVMGLGAWLAAPWFMAYWTIPRLGEVLLASPARALVWAAIFGALWGLGNLTFGLSVRYLGMGLGYAVALGFCMVFGTLIPPLYAGLFGSAADKTKLVNLVMTTPGQVVILGIAVCLAGIALCGWAGMRREWETQMALGHGAKNAFILGKGFLVATASGILSACFAFGLAAGKPIAQTAHRLGAAEVFSNNATLVVILIGGLLSNAAWCLFLNLRNRTFRDYVGGHIPGQVLNYGLALIAGIVWYFQFFFYGMGTTKLGPQYDFSSWSIHMAFIIVFSNLWGIAFQEWRGTRFLTQILVLTAIVVLILSTGIIGYGNYLDLLLQKSAAGS
ncbi:MAG: L-rhamnose/proton symporter RhaT [Thermogutta sp.]